jgi:hypothetical protein
MYFFLPHSRQEDIMNGIWAKNRRPLVENDMTVSGRIACIIPVSGDQRKIHTAGMYGYFERFAFESLSEAAFFINLSIITTPQGGGLHLACKASFSNYVLGRRCQSMWNIGFNSVQTGELSGFTSIISAIISHHFRTIGISFCVSALLPGFSF